MFNGILLVDKPKGVTSFQYMKKIGRKLGIPKVGHLGTLDPNASGLLVLLCGTYTKRNQEFSNQSKTYRTLVKFGIETDTLDPDGRVTRNSDVVPSTEAIVSVLPCFTGEIQQTVPHYSAVKIDGKRAYDLARQNIEFTPPTKTVVINKLELLEPISPGGVTAWLEMECGTGTYVRSLVKDLAKRLGTVAIAEEIVRTRIGEWRVEGAKTLENIELEDMISW